MHYSTSIYYYIGYRHCIHCLDLYSYRQTQYSVEHTYGHMAAFSLQETGHHLWNEMKSVYVS